MGESAFGANGIYENLAIMTNRPLYNEQKKLVQEGVVNPEMTKPNFQYDEDSAVSKPATAAQPTSKILNPLEYDEAVAVVGMGTQKTLESNMPMPYVPPPLSERELGAGPQGLAVDSQEKPVATSAAGADVQNTLRNFYYGGIANHSEVGRRYKALEDIANLNVPEMPVAKERLDFVATPKAGYTQNDVDYQKALLDKAKDTAYHETVLPGAMVVAPVFGPVAAAIPFGAALGETAVKTYKNTEGTQFEKTGNAYRESTYGRLAEMLEDRKKLARELRDRPVSAALDLFAATGQAIFPFIGAAKGVRGVTGYKKTAAKRIDPSVPPEEVKPSGSAPGGSSPVEGAGNSKAPSTQDIAFPEYEPVTEEIKRQFNTPEVAAKKAQIEEYKKSTGITNTLEHYAGDPNRIAEQERIAGNISANGVPQIDSQGKVYYNGTRPEQGRKAYIVTGLAGAGKSSMFAEPLANKRHAILADSDLAKPELLEYKESGGLLTGVVHEESAKINLDVIRKAAFSGDNIVIPTVGRSAESLVQMRDALKRQGYEVNLIHVEVDPLTAARRGLKRSEETGRFVDTDDALGTNLLPRDNYVKLRKEGGFDSYEAWDNNSPVPVLLDRGGKGQEPLVDARLYGKPSGLRTEEMGGRDGSREEGRTTSPAAKEIANSETLSPQDIQPGNQTPARTAPGRFSFDKTNELAAGEEIIAAGDQAKTVVQLIRDSLKDEKRSILPEKMGEVLPHLYDLGKKVFAEGFTTPHYWYTRMKEHLGDMWGHFKGHIGKVWRAINNDRGSMRLSFEPGENLDSVADTLRPLIGKPQEARPLLLDIGRQVLRDGHIRGYEWYDKMRERLGDTWPQFRVEMTKVWRQINKEQEGAKIDTASLSEANMNPESALPEPGREPGRSSFEAKRVTQGEFEGASKAEEGINPFDGASKLKPSIKYKSGEYNYSYETDGMGRISKFETDNLKLTKRENRLGHNPNTPGKLDGDHAGHLAGDRFGGSSELDNLVSQSQNVNLSQYKKIENQWAQAIKEGKRVKVNVDVKYEGNSLRPSKFIVQYEIDGEAFSRDLLN